MAAAEPWANPDFHQLLERKIGSDWAQRLEDKWGAEWDRSCVDELAGALGSGWQDDLERATDTLVDKLGTVASGAEPEATPPDPDSEVHLDFSRYTWLNTFNEADSFSSWLTRIGVSADDTNAIINAEGGSETGDQPETPDQDEIVTVDLSQYQWLNTLTEADSFESWLMRIGVSAEDAKTIINAESAHSSEENT